MSLGTEQLLKSTRIRPKIWIEFSLDLMRIGCLSNVLVAAIHAAHGAEVQGINNSPDVLRFIQSAETVYVPSHISLEAPARRQAHAITRRRSS